MESNSWEQLRANTISRTDKTIQWVTPHRPVISAYVPGQGAFLDPEKPGSTSQLLRTIYDMGNAAGLLVKVTTRDLRNGSASDISHLKNDPRGFAITTTASALGRKMTSFMMGATERYTDDSNISIRSLRAESDWADTRAPTFATTPFVPRVIKKYELEAYCETRGWDSTASICQERARRDLRQADLDKWREECKASGDHAAFIAPLAFDNPSKFISL